MTWTEWIAQFEDVKLKTVDYPVAKTDLIEGFLKSRGTPINAVHLGIEMERFVSKLPDYPEQTYDDLTEEQWDTHIWAERWKESLDPHHQGYSGHYWDDDDYYYDCYDYLDEQWEDDYDYHLQKYEEFAQQAAWDWDRVLDYMDNWVDPDPVDPYDYWYDYQEQYMDDRQYDKKSYSPY